MKFLSLRMSIHMSVQDILALQLMRLFQNIFEQEGLELYLYTYRVIATSPGVSIRPDVRKKTITNAFSIVWSDRMRTEFSFTRRYWTKYRSWFIRIFSACLWQR